MLHVDDVIGRWLRDKKNQKALKNNPSKGKRLDHDEYFKIPEDQRMLMHVLKNANYLPPAVQLMKKIKDKEEELKQTCDTHKKEELKCQIICLQQEKDSLVKM